MLLLEEFQRLQASLVSYSSSMSSGKGILFLLDSSVFFSVVVKGIMSGFKREAR